MDHGRVGRGETVAARDLSVFVSDAIVDEVAERLTSEVSEPDHLPGLRVHLRVSGTLAARVHEPAALEVDRINLERLAVLMQRHQPTGMVDDIDVRWTRI